MEQKGCQRSPLDFTPKGPRWAIYRWDNKQIIVEGQKLGLRSLILEALKDRIHLDYADLTAVELMGMEIGPESNIWPYVRFDWAGLSQTRWSNSTFWYSSFRNARIQHAKFTRCRFVWVDFNESQMNSLRMTDCVFENCDFTGVNLTRAKWTGCKFRDCNFAKITDFYLNIKGCEGLPALGSQGDRPPRKKKHPPNL